MIKKRIIITEEADLIISEIIEDYKLESSPDEYFEKLEKNERPPELILIDLIKKRAKNEILEKELASSLEKKLGFSKEDSGVIQQKIQKEVLPFLKEAEGEKEEEETKEDEVEEETIIKREDISSLNFVEKDNPQKKSLSDKEPPPKKEKKEFDPYKEAIE